ncbi:hypothetical protein NNC19_05455 [Clostridium sp. SHJSY1]|uniref:hypothetical protein n=1 Tax=Clostridium sp. SHJSY1 TaxID=2942483 RepID=UPI0028762C9B|nr:hypothetical protein [Clostridium sp. SHJSY1]MDS0525120.1 hypothetical protein [Clostridium sp. SHJSY1]
MDMLERKKLLEREFIEEAKNKKKLKEKKRKEEIANVLKDIQLYPKATDVLENEELECFFRPILTIKRDIKGKEFLIHILLSLGISEDKLCDGHKFSENGFFGFEYNGGKYKYVGSEEVFYNQERTKALNLYLQADFIEQKEIYLSKKIGMEVYVEKMMKRIKSIVQLGSCGSLRCYLESFYSYELTKYQYQATGSFRSFREITEGWKTSSDFVHDEKNITNIIDEFFMNIEYNFKNYYDITPDMACFGIDAFNFMASKDMLFTLVDAEKERLYMLEYCS